MNITTLTKAIEVLANSATTAQDILILSKVLERLRLGNVTAVATYYDMLVLRKNTGDLVFVDSEQKLYFLRVGGIWTSIVDANINGVWAWGRANEGQLGDNTSINKSSPVSVVGGFTDWVQVSTSAGSSHNMGLRANGTAWGWGYNGVGQIGDGTAVSKSSPVSVVGGFTDWVQVSAGGNHTTAIRSNGTAWGWGYNGFGRLGDNTTVNKSSPVSVVGGFIDWIQVSASTFHTAGVRANGSAWGWGSNGTARLGDNTTVDRSSPVSVVGGFTDWIQVSAGVQHTVGVRANGTAWAWGQGVDGQLGDNTTVNKSSPVAVVGGFTDWIQISAGTAHNIGVRATGTAWAWGNGANGRLGNNFQTNRSSPVSVVGGFTDWIQASAGNTHTVGLRANGTLWAWGDNGSGRFGDGTIASPRSSPVSVVGGFTDWIQIGAGAQHTVALR